MHHTRCGKQVPACRASEIPASTTLTQFCLFLPDAAVLPLCPQASRVGLLIAKGEAPGTERMGSLGHPECCQLGTQTGCWHTPHLGPSPWKGNLSIRMPSLPLTMQSPSSSKCREWGWSSGLKASVRLGRLALHERVAS